MQSVYLQRIMNKKMRLRTMKKQTQFPQSQKRTQTLLQQRIMKMKPPSGSEKQTQSKPILEAMFVNFCAAGYYRRVALVPLDEHIDIICQRFSFSEFVIILNMELEGIYLFASIDDACNIPGVNRFMVFFFMHRSI